MEERFRRRQGQVQGSGDPPPWPSDWQQSTAEDNSQFSEEEKTEAWRQMHAVHIGRQTKAIESIRTYVAIWFWLSIIGAVLVAIAVNSASY